MVIAPKNHFKQHSFVDRKVCLQSFKNAVNDLGQKEFSVLVYYGVAGIGKTSLRNEFIKCLETYNKENNNPDITVSLNLQREVIWTSIDLQLDKHRKKNTFLVTLKYYLLYIPTPSQKTQLNFFIHTVGYQFYP